jgi:P pilus assembly chaperone PapD
MRIIIAGFLLLLTQPALAGMSLDKIIVYLDDSPNARDDIVISNPDQENLYLQTEIYRVDNPGMADEKRVRVVNPKEFKLLLSPAKAVLTPGEQKRFRLMSLERDLDREKVYRVTFKPVVGEIKSDRTALKILVAYQALVFVQPKDGKYLLELGTEDGYPAIKNNGNVNVEIVGIDHCQREGDCRALEISRRLYAGTSLPIKEKLEGGYLELQTRGKNAERVRLLLEG